MGFYIKMEDTMSEKSIGRGIIILSISSIILKLLSSIYMPILSLILKDEGVAIYNIGYNYFVFLFAITSLGFQPVITKLVVEEKTKKPGGVFEVLNESKRFLMILGAIVSILFMLLAKPLSIIANSKEVIKVIIFLAPAILFAAILTSYRGFFQGDNDINKLSISNIIEQVFNVVFSLICAFILIKISISFGSAGGAVGTTIGAVGAIIYLRHALNKRYPEYKKKYKKSYNNKILKKLLITAIPFVLIAAIQNLSNIIDTVTVKNLIIIDSDVKIATLGYYLSIVNIPLVIVTSLGIGIFPKIIKGYVEKDKDQLIVQTSYCYKLIYTITIPSICGIMIFAKDIFKFLYGRNFGGEILIIGAISLVFMSLSTIQNIIIQGINQLKYIISVGLFSIVIKTLLNLILIRIENINIIGSVIATIVSLAIVSYLNHIKLEKSFEVKISLIKQGKKSLIASIIMAISLVLIRYVLLNNFIMDNYTRVNVGIVLLSLVTVGGIIYFLSLLFIGGITKYELNTISPKIYDKLPEILKNKVVTYN